MFPKWQEKLFQVISVQKRTKHCSKFHVWLHSQETEWISEYKKIVLLSDGAAGQNKNQTMMRFCSWLSKLYHVDIIHLFPVRGHSFGQCGRNFRVMKSTIKEKEEIELPQGYLEKIIMLRGNPSPYHSRYLYCMTEKKKTVNESVVFRIQQYCILMYKPFG